MPTEISEPPYEVGQLPQIQGYYIERADAPQINFRIVGNKIHLYWIDVDGLIAEPEASEATVRFTGSVRGRSFHQLKKAADDAGLTAPGIMPPPHLYNVILNIKNPEDGTFKTHTFRYLPEMDTATDPEITPGALKTETKPK